MSPTVEMDFYGDWREHIRKQLIDAGYNLDDFADEDLSLLHSQQLVKYIEPVPREVLLTTDFNWPDDNQEKVAVNGIIEDVKNGNDLNRYYSSRLKRDLKFQDAMLFDWKIHHFHLSTVVGSDGFASRTGPLLFAMINDDIFYGIGIYNHRDWSEIEIMKRVYKNWPDLLENYRLRGVTGTESQISNKDRKVLRKKRANVLLDLGNGNVFVPPGGGVMSSGHSTKARIDDDRNRWTGRALEKWVTDNIDDLVTTIKGKDLKIPSNIRFWLEFEEMKVNVCCIVGGILFKWTHSSLQQ